MADAKKCDRCGKLYEETEGNNVFRDVFDDFLDALNSMIGNIVGGSIREKLSEFLFLCPDCRKSFEKWWKEVE